MANNLIRIVSLVVSILSFGARAEDAVIRREELLKKLNDPSLTFQDNGSKFGITKVQEVTVTNNNNVDTSPSLKLDKVKENDWRAFSAQIEKLFSFLETENGAIAGLLKFDPQVDEKSGQVDVRVAPQSPEAQTDDLLRYAKYEAESGLKEISKDWKKKPKLKLAWR